MACIPSPDPMSADDAGLPPAGRDDAREGIPHAAGVESSATCKGRVLLIEDDSVLNDALKDCLTEAGYSVVAARDGPEGVKAVLAGDFSVILCDMMMPGLSGDMFYRAVERARPHLCNRFVFMTGHRCDAKVDEFIRSVHAHGFRKPFHLDDLLCTIRLIDMCGQFAETTDFVSVAPARSVPVRSSVARVQENPTPPRPAHTATVQEAALLLKNETPAPEPRQASGWSFLRACRVLLTFVMLAAIPVSWYFMLVQRTESSTAELSAIEWQWEGISRLLQEGGLARRGLEELARVPDRIAIERNSPKWTSALWAVASAVGEGIELGGVELRGANDLAGGCTFRIDGVSTGSAPRAVAEQLRKDIEAKLTRHFDGSQVTARFARLDVEPESDATATDRRTAAFSIIVGASFDAQHRPRTEKEP